MSFMWGKQNDGQMVQNQQPAQPAHQPVPAPAPAAPVTTQPVAQQTYQPPAPSSSPSPSSSPTVFGKSMKIIGEVSSDEELYLDGDLDGKLYLRNRLTIGPNSKVNADIKAQEVVVFGTIKGNVDSETRVSLRKGASIVGDIKTAGIVIEDGAHFKGGIDISRNGEARNGESKPAPKAQGASAGQKR
jgi:cytoskeletal protein CcmA (bactofilin family)